MQSITKQKGFAKEAAVKMRGFLLELNHIDAEGEETNIAYELLEVPKLNDSSFEMKYVSLVVWDLLIDAYKEEGINQAFVLTRNGTENLMRLQAKEADDEPMTRLNPPDPKVHQAFLDRLKERVKKLYSSDDISYVRSRIKNCNSLKEYFEMT